MTHAIPMPELSKKAVAAAVLGCGVILTGAGPHSCQKFMEPMATGSSMVSLFAFFSLGQFCCSTRTPSSHDPGFHQQSADSRLLTSVMQRLVSVVWHPSSGAVGMKECM